MLISKLPNKPPKPRQFLTKPSSWAKLLVGFGIVGLMVWVNIRPTGQETRNKKQETNKGQVAGEQDSRITDNELLTRQLPGVAGERITNGEQENSLVEGLPAVDFPIPKSDGSELDKTILAANDIRLLFDTGSDALAKNDFNLAQLVYIRITQIAPEYKDAWYYLGYSYLKKFESDPIVKYADPAPTNLDWAIVALNRAHLIAPLSDPVTELLTKATDIKKQN